MFFLIMLIIVILFMRKYWGTGFEIVWGMVALAIVLFVAMPYITSDRKIAEYNKKYNLICKQMDFFIEKDGCLNDYLICEIIEWNEEVDDIRAKPNNIWCGIAHPKRIGAALKKIDLEDKYIKKEAIP